jgi:hypothetical protein
LMTCRHMERGGGVKAGRPSVRSAPVIRRCCRRHPTPRRSGLHSGKDTFLWCRRR